MATALVSPGVRWNEYNLSNYIPQISSTQFCVLGTATKGPVNTRVLITSTEQYIKTFGYTSKDHLATYAAMSYLTEGSLLWFTRVESSISPATSATIAVKDVEGHDLVIKTANPGTFYNGLRVVIDHGSPRVDMSKHVVTAAEVTSSSSMFTTTNKLLMKGTVTVMYPDTVGTHPIFARDDGEGHLLSNTVAKDVVGTVNYLTGAITLTHATAPTEGQLITVHSQYTTTFNMTTYRTVNKKEFAIEKVTGMTLVENAQHYYAEKLANTIIFSYFDLTSFPAQGSYTFAGGTDGTEDIADHDFIGADYGVIQSGLQLYSSADQTDINVIAVPGQTGDAVVQALVALSTTRADCIALIDTPQNLDPQTVVDWADGVNNYESRVGIDSTYAAIYYPWLRIQDKYTGDELYIPPSGHVAAAYARTDRIVGPNGAPAGIDTGRVLGVIGTERILGAGDRDHLYSNRINPVNDFATLSVLIWGQRTATKIPTSADRVNVRRSVMMIEKTITTLMMPYVFKPHTNTTWASIVNKVQPYLNGLVARGILVDGQIVVNEITNPTYKISQNILTANIFIIPTNTAEQIVLNFVMLDAGAQISEYAGQQFN